MVQQYPCGSFIAASIHPVLFLPFLPMNKRKPQSSKDSTPIPLTCPHCGLDHNNRGQPFTQSTLVLHIRKRHPDIVDEEDEQKPADALACDICGRWKSKRGLPFLSQADLVRHRTLTHPESRSLPAGNGSPASNPNGTAPTKRKSRQAYESVPVKFCPQCGCNVEVIAAALSFLR